MKKKGQEGAIITSREKEKRWEKGNLVTLRETSPHSAVGRLPGGHWGADIRSRLR